MTKKQMESLIAGSKVMNIKTSEVLTVAGMDKEQGKYILSNGRCYTTSTIKRWWTLVQEEEQKDNTVQEKDDTQEQQDTTATTATNTQGNEIHDQHDTTTKKHIVEGDTTTPGQQIFENSISGVVLQYGCHLNRMNQYIKVGKQGKRGTLVYIRKARDKSWKFDVSKRTWNKLTPEYQTYLVDKYDARIVDSTRGLWRVCCNELDVFEVLLLTAIHSSQE